MSTSRNNLILFSLIIYVGASDIPAFGQGQRETVAAHGDSANGDGTFFAFQEIFLNNEGDVSFQGSITDTSAGALNNHGVYVRSSNGSMTEIVRESDSTPSGNGIFDTEFSLSNYGLNDSGQSLIYSKLIETSGGLSDNTGLFLWTNGNLTEAVREGDPAFDGNGEFGHFDDPPGNSRFGFSDAGQISVRNLNVNTNGGAADDQAIFGNSFTAVREGQAAPQGIGNFSTLNLHSRVNRFGQISFVGNVGLGGNAVEGVYQYDPTSQITPIYIEGDAAPDGNGTFSSIVGPLSFNNAGQVAFAATMDGSANGTLDDRALIRSDGNSVVQIAREGNPAPNGNGFFTTFGAVQINDANQVTFRSFLRDTSGGYDDDVAVFRSDSSGLTLFEIAREGQETNDGTLGSIAALSMNVAGHVAFDAGLDNTANFDGVFIGDGEELITVVQRGQSIAGITVSRTRFWGGEGFQSGLNNHGQVVYEIEFSGGGKFVQIWTPDLHWRRDFGGDWDCSDCWTLGISPGPIYDVYLNSDNRLEVDGPAANTTVHGLSIGGGNGIATLDMRQGAILAVTNDVTIEANGILTGDGTIAADIENRGTIEANEVIVNGTIDNTASGVINVTGGGSATFEDDVVQNGVLLVERIGNDHSSATFLGGFSGAGGFTGGGDVFALGDLRPGNGTASVNMGGNLSLGMQTQSEFEIGGVETGEFDQLIVAGNLLLDGSLDVVLVNGFTPNVPDEFLIVDVGGDAEGEFAGLANGSSVGSGLYISYDGGDGNDVVLLTVSPQVQVVPDTLSIIRGDLRSGDLADLTNSDNSDLSIVRSTADIQSRTEFEVASISPAINPSSLSITLEGSVFARSPINQTISLYDYDLDVWEVVDTRNANRFDDRVDTIVVTGDVSRFVETRTNRMKARVLYESVSPRQQFGSNTDHFLWSVGG